MNTPWTFPSPTFRREFAVLAALAILGAGLRAWNLGRLGLNHFDEGIYAFAGLWAFSPHGLADLDPALIPYAPPGFAVLVGLMYSLLGVSDTAAILVSIVMGSATIVVVGLIGRRTFGPGGGVASAAIATFAGPHIAFSRMALCDVSFLFFWLIAIWQGQRFLERPNGVRALGLGVAVGLAQLFKYSGWIAGLIVILTAVLQMAVTRDWSGERLLRVWGWGLVAAAIALLVYAPWILFVQHHGGYAALLAHQRGYMGGVWSWPSHLMAQHNQAREFEGGAVWRASAALVCSAAIFIVLRVYSARLTTGVAFVQTWAFAAFFGGGPNGLDWYFLAIGSPALLFVFRRNLTAYLVHHPAVSLLVGFYVLTIMTPFYRPYARLWLPVESYTWFYLGGVFWLVSLLATQLSFVELPRDKADLRKRGLALIPLPLFAVFSLVILHNAGDGQSVLAPSDSLRTACFEAARFLPRDVPRVVVLARPSALFYLSMAGLPVERQGDLAGLSHGADGRAWAIVDAVQLRQEGIPSLPDKRMGDGWSVVRVFSSLMTAATLYDVDPAATRLKRSQINANAPLFVLKPAPAGNPSGPASDRPRRSLFLRKPTPAGKP